MSQSNFEIKKNILFIMTGSIACYKACSVLSKLQQKGYSVKVVLSPSSLEFIGKSTIEGLTGNPPVISLFADGSVMDHIHLNRWADLVIVAPATANYINKISYGLGDDLLTTLFLAHDFTKPFLLAPAMNTKMYLHPATQESIHKLKKFGVEILETASGVLACGEVGYGRLLEPDLIVEEIEKRLQHVKYPKQVDTCTSTQVSKKLKILITGGGTSEPIDDVRVITNKSTGKTATTLVNQLIDAGFEVSYLKSFSAPFPQLDCVVKNFLTFQDLSSQLDLVLNENTFDWIIHAAAVSDYSVEKSVGKLSSDADEITLKLKRNPKLIEKIKSLSPKSKLVGFKLTSSQDHDEIYKKVSSLFEKAKCDYIIQNDWNDISKGNHQFEVYSNTKTSEHADNVQQLAAILIKNILFQENL